LQATQALLTQKEGILKSQLEAEKPNPALIDQTRRDITKLEGMVGVQSDKLRQIESLPTIQKLKNSGTTPSTDAIKTSQNNGVDISKETNIIDTGRQLEQEAAYRKKVETMSQNRKNGDAFAKKVFSVYDTMWDHATTEITILTSKGKVRVDAIGYVTDENGDYFIRIAEFKSSETAPLTKNQQAAFPAIVESGGVVVGNGKGEFTGGTIIPPGTIIEIVRGTAEGDWYVSYRYE
jgi:hypothetical protein